MTDPRTCTLTELAAALEKRALSSVEATSAFLEAAERLNPRLNAYMTLNGDQALETARQSDQRRACGENRGPLDGIPLAIKDNICTRGLRTTCSSRILDSFVPPYDATVIERLHASGAVTLGKTNLDEFAMGSSTENSGYGPSRNPWDPTRAPGGSSGGSAAAVAAGLCAGALGSDTGGSIRQPAALCGIVGLRPTYGRVSRYGLVAFSSSLDQIGPMTRTVADTALLLRHIAGIDERDSTSVPEPAPDYPALLDSVDLSKVTLGVPREYFGEGLEASVERAVTDAIAWYRSRGAKIRDVSLPNTKYGIATYYLVANAEASSNLARYDGIHYGVRAKAKTRREVFVNTRSAGFGPEVRRRIMLGTFCLSAGYAEAYYVKGLKMRTLIRREFAQVFEDCTAIIGPTAPSVAFPLGSKTDDPLSMYLCDVYTVTSALAGLPCLSLPCGFDEQGLPIGLQLVMPPFREVDLLSIAHQYESEHGYYANNPKDIT